MTMMCQEFHVLPHGGGILDQDQLLARKMRIVIDAQNEKHELDKEKKENK